MMFSMVVAREDLSTAEQAVWDAFPTRNRVTFGTEDDDPVVGEFWGADRQVRAEVLVALLSGTAGLDPGLVGGIYLDRARIIGKLELPGVAFNHRLRLTKCHAADGIDLSEATIQTLNLEGCHIGGICLRGAKINGSLTLRDTHVDGKHEPAPDAWSPAPDAWSPALTAAGLTVTSDMMCEKFQAKGKVDLERASIGGWLNLGYAHLDGMGGPALAAQGLTVTSDMFCGDGFRADGAVNLNGASIGGQLGLVGAHLRGKHEPAPDAWSPALIAEGLTVGAGMLCSRLQADGEVDLLEASIGGDLVFAGACLDGKGGPALTADLLTVAKSVKCEGFKADGKVRVPSASIGGQLIFRRAHLRGEHKPAPDAWSPALIAFGLTVTSDMFCEELGADGKVDLTGASIGGDLVFAGAHLDGKGGPALTAERLTVTRGMKCERFKAAQFQADGKVDLTGASIAGDLVFAGAHLDGRGGPALTAQGLTVTADMFCGRGF